MNFTVVGLTTDVTPSVCRQSRALPGAHIVSESWACSRRSIGAPHQGPFRHPVQHAPSPGAGDLDKPRAILLMDLKLVATIDFCAHCLRPPVFALSYRPPPCRALRSRSPNLRGALTSRDRSVPALRGLIPRPGVRPGKAPPPSSGCHIVLRAMRIDGSILVTICSN